MLLLPARQPVLGMWWSVLSGPLCCQRCWQQHHYQQAHHGVLLVVVAQASVHLQCQLPPGDLLQLKGAQLKAAPFL